MSRVNLHDMQRELCAKYDAEFRPVSPEVKLGIAENVRQGLQPINGLRHPPSGDTSGWYVWGGEELCRETDFFKPLHIEHLDEWCPQIQKYLGLPPGWRFLVANGYEDVWFDPTLLEVD